jgi:NADPH:quinone reductase-like Zn-dependent oxidoreductase
MRGSPYFMRFMSGLGAPNDVGSGVDFAGVVEAIGKNVTEFKVGDRVFGGRGSAFAEYLVMPETKAITHIPAGISFEQAAAVPIAGITAIQALKDIGNIKAGDKVLVNGASGGVGTYAVQMAKAYGAEVTGVSSTKNHAMVKGLGADHMIDYKTHNYTDDDVQYDMVIDNIGNHSFSANADVLTPTGKLIMIGGAKGDWIGPMINPIKGMLQAPFLDQEFVMLLAEMNEEGLSLIAEMMQQGKVKSQIDKRYPLEDIKEAIKYSESGRAKGKIIINID